MARFQLLGLVGACLLGIAASAVNARATLRASHLGGTFVRVMTFKHKLRVCNAYPYASPLDVYLGKDKVTPNPMPYKKCGDLSPNLKPGDKIEFKVGDASAGTFSVSDLPNNDATLLLVIYRHDTLSTAVAFESHVFANLLNAQIAVIDSYKGPAKATPRIQDQKDSQLARSEELRYDSVVAVNQGAYEVVLMGGDGEIKAKKNLIALNRESYVIMRCGVDAQQGKTYPQDLIIFPESDPKVLTGKAAARSPVWLALAVVAAALAMVC